MKIKVLSLLKEDIEKGFKNNNIYPVSKVEFTGDGSGWDIYYRIVLDNGVTTIVNDFCAVVIGSEKKYNKFLKKFRKFDIPYHFELNLILDEL